MTFNQLIAEISRLTFHNDIEYMLYPAGIEGRFHLGEKGFHGLHLIDATSEEVIEFVSTRATEL